MDGAGISMGTEIGIEKALCWIVQILQKHYIPFQITGGLAARAYGATRPINDIDVDIPEERFEELAAEVKPYIVYGPAQFKDKVWDVLLMKLNYYGQDIDIGGAYKVKLCDELTGIWKDLPADFSKAEQRELFGLLVPVVNRDELAEYKKIVYAGGLGGEHQKEDVESIHKKL